MILLNEIPVQPTIFPDGTSQVWKLPEVAFNFAGNNVVHWHFENEAEIFHVCQLADLLYETGLHASLIVNYLPYARQDKEINNQSSFALRTFAKIINKCGFEEVEFIDAHSHIAEELICGGKDIVPDEYVNNAIKESGATTICYPDAGAKTRYSECLSHELPVCSFSKERDQLTGYIKRLYLNELISVQDQTVLIVDDICDGGMTFKLTAERLLEIGAREVHLYVSHGIFSKGLETIRESGIKRIFTHKGEV